MADNENSNKKEDLSTRIQKIGERLERLNNLHNGLSLYDLKLFTKVTKFIDKAEFDDGRDITWEDIEFAQSELMLAEEVKELLDATKNKDKREVLDGALDVMFIAFGIALKVLRVDGHNFSTANDNAVIGFDRVCESNLSKINPDGTVTKENGKIVKPKGYHKPYFDDLFNDPDNE